MRAGTQIVSCGEDQVSGVAPYPWRGPKLTLLARRRGYVYGTSRMGSIRHSSNSSLHLSVDAAFALFAPPAIFRAYPRHAHCQTGAPSGRQRRDQDGKRSESVACAPSARLSGGDASPPPLSGAGARDTGSYVPAYHPCALLQPLLVPADGALQSVAAPLNHTPNPDLRGTVGQPCLATGILARTHHACAVARASRKWASPADARCSASTNMTDRLHSSMAHRAAEAYERA